MSDSDERLVADIYRQLETHRREGDVSLAETSCGCERCVLWRRVLVALRETGKP